MILFCAEQGFVGAFNDRMLDAAGNCSEADDLFLIGTRGDRCSPPTGGSH